MILQLLQEIIYEVDRESNEIENFIFQVGNPD